MVVRREKEHPAAFLSKLGTGLPMVTHERLINDSEGLRTHSLHLARRGIHEKPKGAWRWAYTHDKKRDS